MGVVVVGHISHNNDDPHPARLRFALAVDPPHKGEGRSACTGGVSRADRADASATNTRMRTTRSAADPRTEVSGLPRYPYSQCQTARCRMCPPPLSHSFEPQFFPNRGSLSLPWRLRRPGISFVLLPSPRGWRSADRRYPCSCRAGRARRHLARLGSAQREAASRRSAVALSAAGPASRLRHCRRHLVRGLHATGRSARPRPRPLGPRLSRGRRHARSVIRIVSGDAPHERDVGIIRQMRYRSQYISASRSEKTLAVVMPAKAGIQ